MTPEETDVLFEHTRQLRRDIRHAQNNSRRRGDQIEGSADVVEVVSDETSDLDNDKWIAEGSELDKPDKSMAYRFYQLILAHLFHEIKPTSIVAI